MSTAQTVYIGPVTEESLQRIPAFVAKQLLSYRGKEREHAVWTLRFQESGFIDLSSTLFQPYAYYSFLPRGSSFWLEQNPSRITPCPVDTSTQLPDGWNHIDMWVIHWDTSEDDSIDELDVIGITFPQLQK
jgi:hypothetical protein